MNQSQLITTEKSKSSWRLFYKTRTDSLLNTLIDSIKHLNQNSLFKKIQAFIKITSNDKPKLILETGIGLGAYSIGLAKMGYKVVGIDYSSEAILVLKQFINQNEIQNINLIKADVRAMPLRSVFTHILSLGVIEHFENPIFVLKQTIVPLYPNSLLFIDTPNRRGILNRIYAIRRRYEQKKGIWRLGLERSFSTEELRKFVKIIKMKPLFEFNLNIKLALSHATHFSSATRSTFIIQKILALFYILLEPIINIIPSVAKNTFGFFSVIIAKK